MTIRVLMASSLLAATVAMAPLAVAQQRSTGPTKPDVAATCNAEPARQHIGEQATPDVVERVKELSKAAVTRVIEPGEVVTQRYRADRINIDVDAKNVITNVRCG